MEINQHEFASTVDSVSGWVGCLLVVACGGGVVDGVSRLSAIALCYAMGNRSSTHYPPPLEWSQGQYTSYHSNSSGPHDIKRNHNGLPGAYAEPYALHPILRRSMMSLNADSGYLTSPKMRTRRKTNTKCCSSTDGIICLSSKYLKHDVILDDSKMVDE
ncbi:hypothetical protein DICVIV_01948 [Dictyocaulus viviparus]|uniref:Uncharacterized protein n=1 Tax=Dictyocaulus viviparus TaxID=29172 RepID=A0A0D8Y7C3_DICVI|nr:hypothetical protein DICVIV_01948 [Dictyocaulus viviparus]